MSRSLSSTGTTSGRLLRRCFAAGVDWIHPPVCAWCLADTPPNGERTAARFCDACVGKLGEPPERVCERCGAPVGPFVASSQGCFYCKGRKLAFETVVALGVYDAGLREACLRAKSSGAQPMAAALAARLWTVQQTRLEGLGIESVVAVPQHWRSRVVRLHNPAAVMAEVLAGRLKVPLCRHILAKIRKTAAQTSLPRTLRLTNLRNAFRVRQGGRVFGTNVLGRRIVGRRSAGNRIAGKTVLLVDDVLTTGATAGEVSRTLLNAGARRVVVAVIARGLGRRQ